MRKVGEGIEALKQESCNPELYNYHVHDSNDNDDEDDEDDYDTYIDDEDDYDIYNDDIQSMGPPVLFEGSGGEEEDCSEGNFEVGTEEDFPNLSGSLMSILEEGKLPNKCSMHVNHYERRQLHGKKKADAADASFMNHQLGLEAEFYGVKNSREFHTRKMLCVERLNVIVIGNRLCALDNSWDRKKRGELNQVVKKLTGYLMETKNSDYLYIKDKLRDWPKTTRSHRRLVVYNIEPIDEYESDESDNQAHNIEPIDNYESDESFGADHSTYSSDTRYSIKLYD
jgi:hypothetical protein